MQKSVLDSCAIAQNPCENNSGTFVVKMAPEMITNKGRQASLLRMPANSSSPQTISKLPTSVAVNSGQGNPIFVKRPPPNVSANKNFWIPSDKKTSPTIHRIKKPGEEKSKKRPDKRKAPISTLSSLKLSHRKSSSLTLFPNQSIHKPLGQISFVKQG